jgi:hypothetical protein
MTAFDVCEAIRLHVLDALIDADAQPVTTTFTAIGEVAWDDPCGQLTVAPIRIYRSTAFPQEETDLERCDTGDVCVVLSVLLLRCEPSLSDSGAAPSSAAMSAADRSILADAATVWNAVTSPFDPALEWERAAVSQSFGSGTGGAITVETFATIGIPYGQWVG